MANIKSVDNFDLKIIDEMTFNSRVPLKELSRKLGRSKAFVNFRLNSLIKKGIIEKIYPIIDVTSLGFVPLDVFIKTQMGKEEEEDFIKSLKKEYQVYYIERLAGLFSIRFSFFDKSYLKALSFIERLFNDSSKILEVKVYPLVNLLKINRSLVIEKRKEVIEFFNSKSEYALSKKEKEIVKEINKDPRNSLLKISEKLKMSRDFIKKSIKKMEEGGMIRGYAIDIDIPKLGGASKLINLELSKIDKKSIEDIKNYLIDKKSVQTISIYFPGNFISLEMNVKTNVELRDFEVDLIEKFKKCIVKLDVLDYYDEPKYSYMDEFLENVSL